MPRYRPSPELLQISKEDLPDDIEQLVDNVADKAEDLVDDLIDQYEADLNSKLATYNQDVAKIKSDLESELQTITAQVEAEKEAMSVQINELKAKVDELRKAIDGVESLSLPTDKISEVANELDSRIKSQKDKLTKFGNAIGSYTGSLVGLKLPF